MLVRDFGLLFTAGGRRAHSARVIRADTTDNLTQEGWRALISSGVRTVIDLRNRHETGSGVDLPQGIERLHLPHDAISDREFWGRWGRDLEFGMPRYFPFHLSKHPQRTARVLEAIADAPPGGVVFHCTLGRDRTGLIAMMVQLMIGVPQQYIVEDYLHSHRLDCAASHEHRTAVSAKLGREYTTIDRLAAETVLELGSFAADRIGLSGRTVRRLRERLLQ